MKKKATNQENIKKLVLIGLLTALTIALSYIKIPLVGTVTITLVLPVVVIGAALCGPWVGAWLTVIPNISAFTEAGIFMVYSPVGCIATLLLKGILAGLAAGFIYKAMHRKHPIGAVTCAAVAAPVINSGIFFIGCYIFVWDEILEAAAASGVGVAVLILGLVVINFVAELILNLILCPTILRIINIASKKKKITPVHKAEDEEVNNINE
jgi:riboflavin transporter FmnP